MILEHVPITRQNILIVPCLGKVMIKIDDISNYVLVPVGYEDC